MENDDIHAWAKSIMEDLPRMKGQSSSTVAIHRVPERLRRGENDAYEPRIISFGPYHHGETRLQAMEKYKWRYLEAILSRNKENPLEHYIKMIKEQEAEIRSCYSDDFDLNSSEDFVKMMLMDGCFIVEYFLTLKEGKCDELDSMAWAHPLIEYEVLLLENQLPFFILNNIFDMAITKSSSINSYSYPDSFMDLAIYYLNLFTQKEINGFSLDPVHHLLHLLHSFSLYTPKVEEERSTRTITIAREVFYQGIPNATVLQEAGIRFKSTGLEGCSLDVTFSKGQIIIPLLVLDFAAVAKFRNLIAFEQFYPDYDTSFYKSFTVYAMFMDFIINTQDDVALLQEKGIIRHNSGSNQDVANLFNHLSRGTFFNLNHYLVPLFDEIDEYMGKRRHKWRASLMHNYFNSPWSVLGLVAGGILLVLAFLQTYFSGYSAFPHPSSRPSQ